MVTEAGPFGSNLASMQYGTAELPSVAEARSAFEHTMNDVLREFINQSVQASAIGRKALDEGKYVTLDELTAVIRKG